MRVVAIVCTSSITRVNVHARGALVTRRITLPDELPEGDVELGVGGLTAIAEASSVRAALPDGCARAVLAVRAGVTVPGAGQVTGASVERVRTLSYRRDRVAHEIDHLRELQRLNNLPLEAGIRARGAPDGPRDVTARTADALATSEMLTALTADLDARESALTETLRELEEELDAARLADAQATTLERTGSGHPALTAVVHLTGAGAVAWVDLTYAVPAARWWPVYTLRIKDNGRKATWLAEALVAQLSGEDWTNVQLSLSTADLLFDARLPELSSLRLGKAQTPPRRAYRAPPSGLDRMFEGYDRAFTVQVTTTLSATMTFGAHEAPMDVLLGGSDPQRGDDSEADGSYEQPKGATRDEGQFLTRAGSMPTPTKARRAAPEMHAFQTMASPAESVPRMAPQAMRAKSGGVFGALAEGIASFAPAPGAAGGGGYGPPEPAEELPIEPADAWLDFDALALKPAGDTDGRGRLSRRSDARTAVHRESARQRIETSTAPPGGRDPLQTRGMFDHRYEAEGLAEIPSDGQTHRVSLGTGETSPTMRWRTVPREAAEVYREAELRNPFDAPLLAGPVDVYVDGSLLAVASIDRIDRGGTMHVGMGVEQRLRVARNVRVREETAGILGGDTVAHHDVSIELASALGQSAMVEVIDRLPVSDDKAMEISLVKSSPEHERYTQADRGSAVRGGMYWRVIVGAGAKSSVEYSYKLTFPSKSEIVGGNRRD